MSKRQIIMLLALWIIILPFLGFPPAWDTAFAVVCGALILVLAYRTAPAARAPKGPVPFVEHRSVARDVPPPSRTPEQPVITSPDSSMTQ